MMLLETPLGFLFSPLPFRFFDTVGIRMESVLGDLVEMLVDDFIGTLEAQGDEWLSHASKNQVSWTLGPLRDGAQV
jgi:hypothetical protein